jgi:hypothetical protein
MGEFSLGYLLWHFLNYKSSKKMLGHFSTAQVMYVFILARHGLGNKLGHPGGADLDIF